MLDTLLSVFSPKHKLYKKIKLNTLPTISLANSNSIAMTDVFPFHEIQHSLCKTGISNINFVANKKIDLNPYAQDAQTHKPIYLSPFAEELAEVFNPIFVDTIHLKKPFLFDLSEIGGFSNSKSDLNQYHSIDDFVQNTRPNYVSEVCTDNLEKMLSWPEIRLLNSPETTTDQFFIYGWSPKIFVQNAGGSHHMAAAHYLAKKMNQCVPIQGKVSINLISNKALQNFDSKYAAFAISHDVMIDIGNDLSESGLEYQLVFLRDRDVVFVFFKKTAQNVRIIALFNNFYTSLNTSLKKAVQAQVKNESLLTIINYNFNETLNDGFCDTRQKLAEIYKQAQNEISLSSPNA